MRLSTEAATGVADSAVETIETAESVFHPTLLQHTLTQAAWLANHGAGDQALRVVTAWQRTADQLLNET